MSKYETVVEIKANILRHYQTIKYFIIGNLVNYL